MRTSRFWEFERGIVELDDKEEEEYWGISCGGTGAGSCKVCIMVRIWSTVKPTGNHSNISSRVENGPRMILVTIPMWRGDCTHHRQAVLRRRRV